jgi:glycosyltransferase involved in cell wall biosynthesis
MGGSGVQRPLKLGKYLARLGVDVTFLVPSGNHYHIQDESLLQEVEDQKQIHFLRVEGKTPADSPFLKKWAQSYRERLAPLINTVNSWFYLPDNKKGWIRPALRTAIEAHQKQPFDIVLATAAPYSNLMLAAEIKKRCNLPVIMDLRDDWLKSHLLRYPTKWHFDRMASIERDTLQLADEITVINMGVKTSLKSRLSGIPEPKVLPNGFDPEDFPTHSVPSAEYRNQELAVDELSKQVAKPDQFLELLYNGLFYGIQQPDSFLKGVQLAIQQRPAFGSAVRLHFQGDFFDRHIQFANKLGIEENLIVHGNLPHRDSVKGLFQADVLWLIVPKQSNAESHTPGKLYEYFGTGKPIMALTSEGVSADLLKEYGASFLCEPKNPESVAKALLQIHTIWEKGELPVGNRQFIQQFDRSAQAGQVFGWLKELVQSQRNS